MKKILLSFVLAVAALLPAQSQPYMHLPDSSVIWQSLVLKEMGGGGYTYAYTLSENRDTLINGKVYTKMYAAHTVLPMLEHTYCGSYRSTDSGKVYFQSKGINYEVLIYDFSANVGDTFAVSNSDLPISFFGGGLFYLFEIFVTVDSTDYIFHASALRKILYLHSNFLNPFNFIWIEGIGGPGGFVSVLEQSLNQSYFICMSAGGDQLWPSYEPSTICDTSLPVWGIYSDASVASDLYLSPNPAQDQAKLSSGTMNLSQAQIRLYNMEGRLQDINEISKSSEEISMNVSALPPGVYIVRISSPGGVLSKKLVIVR